MNLNDEENKQMKNKKIVKEGSREEWEDLKSHWTASRKSKMHDQFKAAGEWNKAHPELTCDRCGFKSRNEDYFTISAGGDMVCRDCQHKFAMTNEAKNPMKKSQKKSKWWFDVPGAKFIDNGDWSDPEVQYMGFVLNYWDVEKGLLEDYREEFPEDKNDRGFDAWMAKQGGQNGLMHRHLENLAYAAIDGDVSEEEWLGIPDAYKVGYAAGQPDGDYILYKDWLVDVSDLEYYDKDYDDYFTYQEDPQGFESYYIDKANRGELIDQLNSRVGGIMSESTIYEEGFKDAMKSGLNKVKTGAKKVGKAIGDAFKGPFRKGDHVVLSGEDGEKFKGTITGWNLDKQTYNVMLGNAMNEDWDGEGLEEKVQGMPDRVDELASQIEDIWISLEDDGADVDKIMQLIQNYVELSKIDPEEVNMMLGG